MTEENGGHGSGPVRRVRGVADVLNATYHAWRQDRTMRLGAGLAYYGLFALTPVLLLSVALTRMVFSDSEVQEYVERRLEDVLGTFDATTSAAVTEKLGGTTPAQWGMVGAVSLFVTGSLFFVALEDALNEIWGVPVQSGIVTTIRRRLIAFLIVLLAAALIVVSLAAQAISSLFRSLLPDGLSILPGLQEVVAGSMSWAVVTVAVVLVLRYLPAVDVGWRAALVGGVVTSLLIAVGTGAIGWYLRTFAATSISGAAWSVVAVLIWIYYEAQIFLAGAQLTKVLNLHRPGRTSAPEPDPPEVDRPPRWR